MEQAAKLIEEFREKFGFKAYEGILTIFSRLYARIEQLTKSRDLWKEKTYALLAKNAIGIRSKK